MYKLNTKHTYCHCFVHSVELVVLHICRLMFNLRLICIFLRTSSFHSLCAFIRGKRRKIPNMHSNLITRVRSQFVLILFLSFSFFFSIPMFFCSRFTVLYLFFAHLLNNQFNSVQFCLSVSSFLREIISPFISVYTRNTICIFRFV